MWWALGVLVVIAVGFPLTIGLATRGLGRRPLKPLRPSPAVQWLQERYGLTERAGVRVESAVARGEPAGDPALEDAAHGLAALVVSGRAPGQRQLRIIGLSSMAVGAGCLVVAIVIVGLGHAGKVSALIAYGLFAMANAWVQLVYGPHRRRRQATRALEVNRQAAGARLSFRAGDGRGEGGAGDSGDRGDRQHRQRGGPGAGGGRPSGPGPDPGPGRGSAPGRRDRGSG
jgi:hypothetical protein